MSTTSPPKRPPNWEAGLEEEPETAEEEREAELSPGFG